MAERYTKARKYYRATVKDNRKKLLKGFISEADYRVLMGK